LGYAVRVTAASPSASAQLLEDVYSHARLEAFSAVTYGERLRDELAALGNGSLAELEAADAALRDALSALHAFAGRVMRLHLERALADDRALPVATRKVFATTVLAYAGDLRLLRERAADAARRADPGAAERVGEAVAACARATLELHQQLGQHVFALAAARAAAAVAPAERAARDRTLDDNTRMRWSAVRRDQHALAAQPQRLAEAALSDRVAALAPQLDEPEPEPELSRAQLLELD
jgi:hypothetical protein